MQKIVNIEDKHNTFKPILPKTREPVIHDELPPQKKKKTDSDEETKSPVMSQPLMTSSTQNNSLLGSDNIYSVQFDEEMERLTQMAKLTNYKNDSDVSKNLFDCMTSTIVDNYIQNIRISQDSKVTNAEIFILRYSILNH